jgi:parvulin-like peptidyl-prolyl isomerase
VRAPLAVAAVLAPLAAAVLACRSEPAVPASDAVARIAGSDVPYSAFAAYVERQLGERGSALGSDVLSGLFDRFLDERLLAALAEERGLAPAGTAPRRAVERLLEAEADPGPTAAEVAAHWEAHREEFRRPERVRLRQALFDDRASAERARAEIAAGAGFADAARRHSRNPGIAAGGLQGELARDELPPAFADTIFRLRPYEVSPVVEAEYGFHLFQVVERLPAAEVPIGEARAEIARRLRRERADARLAELVAEARGRYDVTVLERNLPFNYQGRHRVEDR